MHIEKLSREELRRELIADFVESLFDFLAEDRSEREAVRRDEKEMIKFLKEHPELDEDLNDSMA
jgi:hypothetical protein